LACSCISANQCTILYRPLATAYAVLCQFKLRELPVPITLAQRCCIRGLCACVTFAYVFTVQSADAETLLEALSAAYKFNPRLDAARANLRATDEEVPRALAGYKPSVTGSADTSFRHITTNPGTSLNGDSNPRGYQIGLVQPLFRGFRTVNA